MAELFQNDTIPRHSWADVFKPSQEGLGVAPVASNGQTMVAPTIVGGIFYGASYRSGDSGARFEIFPEEDKNTGCVVYNAAGTVVFKTIIDGTDTGDVIVGDYAGGAGAKWDQDATTFDVKGNITTTSGTIGGWVIVSGYIYNLQSGTPTASPSDGLVLASGNEGITVYENTEKRVELGYLSAGVYGIKVYADDGSTVIFEASDVQNLIKGDYVDALTVDKLTAGTIDSKSIVLAAASADVEIRSGIATGDFANVGAASGFILGRDYSDSDTAKFYFGAPNKYIEFDGSDLWINDTRLTNESIFGDGSDGDLSTSGNVTLTRDMYYDDLTVNEGHKIVTAGFRIFVKGTLTLVSGSPSGYIENPGGDGSVGQGGAGTRAGGAGGTSAGGTLPGATPGRVGTNGGTGAIGPGNGSDAALRGAAVEKSLDGSSVPGVTGGNGGSGVAGGGTAGTAGGAGGATVTAYNLPRNFQSAMALQDLKPAPVAIGRGTNYFASSSGIVVYSAYGSDAGGAIQVLSDTNATPTTIIAEDMWTGSSGGGSVTVPIERGKYYKLNLTSSNVTEIETWHSDGFFAAGAGPGGSSGGAGGGGNNVASAGGSGGGGGGSGSTGGFIFVSAKIIDMTGNIQAIGGAGNNGGIGQDGQGGANDTGGGGGGGGGSGGEGGIIILVYSKKSGSGDLLVTGGAAGNGAAGGTATGLGINGSAGNNGNAGGVGKAFEIVI